MLLWTLGAIPSLLLSASSYPSAWYSGSPYLPTPDLPPWSSVNIPCAHESFRVPHHHAQAFGHTASPPEVLMLHSFCIVLQSLSFHMSFKIQKTHSLREALLGVLMPYPFYFATILGVWPIQVSSNNVSYCYINILSIHPSSILFIILFLWDINSMHPSNATHSTKPNTDYSQLHLLIPSPRSASTASPQVLALTLERTF